MLGFSNTSPALGISRGLATASSTLDAGVTEALVRQITASRKYRYICEDTVRDVVLKSLPKYRRKKEAIKAARTKLHRIQASYLGRISFGTELKVLAKAHHNGQHNDVRRICLRLMAQHASAKERIPLLDDFYRKIFSVTGTPQRILDIASGVHPLSIPWMNLPNGVDYFAYEIDSRLVAFLNQFFNAIGYKPLAKLEDVICNPPKETADLGFVMKMVPCLEAREAGISLQLLRSLKVKFVVVSYPIRSLSGRSRNMPSFYTKSFQSMVEGMNWSVTRLPIEDELVFV